MLCIQETLKIHQTNAREKRISNQKNFNENINSHYVKFPINVKNMFL